MVFGMDSKQDRLEAINRKVLLKPGEDTVIQTAPQGFLLFQHCNQESDLRESGVGWCSVGFLGKHTQSFLGHILTK